MIEISKSAVVNRVSNAVTAGETAITSSILNMAGFGVVAFIAEFNTVVDTSVLTLTAMENSTNGTSGATAVAGGSVTFTASGSSNGMLVLDVIRPSKQYVYCVLTRTTANATVDSILALQYRSTNAPVTQPASVLASGTSTPEV